MWYLMPLMGIGNVMFVSNTSSYGSQNNQLDYFDIYFVDTEILIILYKAGL